MSFTQSHTHQGIELPAAYFRIIERNAHDGEQRGRIVLAYYANEAAKVAALPLGIAGAWDIQAEAQFDENGQPLTPSYNSVFGYEADGSPVDTRRAMYLFIRSLPEYSDAKDC